MHPPCARVMGPPASCPPPLSAGLLVELWMTWCAPTCSQNTSLPKSKFWAMKERVKGTSFSRRFSWPFLLPGEASALCKAANALVPFSFLSEILQHGRSSPQNTSCHHFHFCFFSHRGDEMPHVSTGRRSKPELSLLRKMGNESHPSHTWLIQQPSQTLCFQRRALTTQTLSAGNVSPCYYFYFKPLCEHTAKRLLLLVT